MTPERRSATGRRAHRAAIAAALALAPVLGVVAFTTASAPPAAASADVPTFPVLVANSGADSVSDIGPSGTTTLDVGSDPDGVAITPDGTYAYVANFFSTSVSVIDGADTASPTVSPTTLDVGSGPSGVAITPDGKYAYVVNDKAASVSVIDTADTASPSVSATTLDVGNGPDYLAITPDGKYAYVANDGSATVSVIDTADTTHPSVSGTALDVGSGPIAVAITPDGRYAYVVNQSGTVSVIDTADTADPTVSSTTLTVGNNPWSVAITPDGQYAYVANEDSSSVSVIDTADTTHPSVSATTLTVGEGPEAVAITPDGQYAYVADSGSATVSVIDTASTAAPTVSTTTVAVGTAPDAVAVVPDQAPVAAISATPAPAGRPTSFSATGSTVAYGTIASYAWTFGDGSAPVTTSTDTTTHVYASAGTYTASVTETDSAGTSITRVFTGQTVSDNGGPSAVATTSVTVSADTSPVLVANSGADSVSDIGPSGTTTLDVGTDPFAVAITPDGKYAYVTNEGSGTVSVIDTADTPSPTASATTLTVGATPSGVAITPDGKYAYVTNEGSGTVSVIDTADTPSPTASATTLTVGATPSGVAITPDGKYAYVTNYDHGSSSTVSVIDTADTAHPTVSGTALDAGTGPIAVAVTPDGKYAYVTNFGSGTVSVIDTADTSTPTVTTTTLTTGGDPRGVAITPDGKYAYVTNFGSDTVSVIDTADTSTPTVSTTTLTVGTTPLGVATSPDGKYAYVTNQVDDTRAGDVGDTVSVIDGASTDDPSVSATSVTVKTIPAGVAVVPDQAPVAAISATPAPAGRPTSFSATGSTVAYGTIASYAWTFGDGSAPVTTSTDTTTHVYASAGTYTASVTETDSAGTSITQVFTGQTVSDNGGPSAVATTSVTVTTTSGPPPSSTGPTAPAPPPVPTGATSHHTCSVSSGTCTATNDTVAVTASPGPGALTVSEYASDPEGAPSFSSTGSYFDVEVTSGSSFSSVTLKDCNLSGGTALYWWDPTTGTWDTVSPVSGPSGTPSCLTADLTATSTPTIAELTGTVLAVGAPPAPSTTRVAGATADATAAAELTRAFPSTKGSCPATRAAVLATTKVYQDALSSQFLAQSLTTGTLLTPPTSLSSVTATTLEDEGVKTVYVVGGPLAITTTVVTAIEALPADECGGTDPTGTIAVTRITGETQYGTAAAVATHVDSAASLSFAGAYATTNAAGGNGAFNDTAGLGTAAPTGSVPTAILASGAEFQDAQAASVVSYRTKLPLLLTPATTLSTTAVGAIEKLGVKQVVLMGGPLAVTNTVEAALVAKTGVSVLRVAGSTYPDTAAELARFEAASSTAGLGLGWTPGHRIMVARGNGFTDGLAGAVLESAHNTATGAATTARPLLLTESPTTLGTSLATFLKVTGHTGIDKATAKTITALTVLGGTLAVSTAVVTAMETDLAH